MKKLFVFRWQRAMVALAAICTLALSLALPGIAPYLGTAHAEAGTQIIMPLGGNRYLDNNYNPDPSRSTPDDDYFGMANCVGRITTIGLSADNLQKYLHSPGINSATEKFGPADATPKLKDQYTKFIKANTDNNVSGIEFVQAPTTPTGTTKNCDGKWIMIPAESFAGPNDTNPDNPKVWVAWHHRISYTGIGDFMIRFTAYGPTSDGKSTAGTLEYFEPQVQNINGKDQRVLVGVQKTNVVIEGVAKPSAPVVTGNYTSARFIDAHEIEVVGKINGSDVTETYVDPKWDNKLIYYLATSTNNTRTNVTFGNQNPNVDVDPRSAPANNKTPFIALGGPGVNLDFNGSTVSNFQNGISQLGNSDVLLYDYDVTGVPSPNDGRGLPVASNLKGLIDRARANVWFYYSSASKAATTVFRSSAGNETNYVGSYAAATDNSGNGELLHAATNCQSLGSLKIDTSGASSTGTIKGDWTLRQPNQGCVTGSGFGTVSVQVISNEDSYNGIVNGNDPSEATLPVDNQVGRLICDVSILNPITWLMCPIATAATSAVDQLDSAINDMLNINGDQYFGNNDTGNKLYTTWKNLRTISMGIVVIVALFMVIAQASGWEILSALTFRKMLLNFVITLILLTLWWPIGRAIIQFGDVATYGIRMLIYAPFGGSGSIHLEQGTSAVLALLGTGTILALGIFATATFAITAFMAIAIGYAILLIRLMVVIGGQTLSAIFIPFRVIPNSPVWKFFWGSWWKAVALGPILAGAIALARVFAKILYQASNGRLSFHIAALVVYFGIYGALAQIVSALGGLAATLAGRINDRSRGLFDRMKNIRSKSPGNRYKRLKHGEFFADTWLTNKRRRGPLGAIGRAGDRVGERLGLGLRNQFGFGETGRAAAALQTDAHIDDTLRNNGALRSLGLNHDNANAVLALSGSTVQGARAAIQDINRGHRELAYNQAIRNGQTVAQAQVAAANARQIDAAEENSIMSMITPFLGNRTNVAAAARNMMQNKARAIAAGDIASLDAGMNRFSEGNEVMAQQMKSSLAYFGRSSGRVDLGGEWTQFYSTNPNTGAVTLQGRAAQLQAMGGIDDRQAIQHANMLDAIGRTTVANIMTSHPGTINKMADTIRYVLKNANPTTAEGAALRQEAAMRALELQKGLSSGMASGDVQRDINGLMTQLGITYGNGSLPVAEQLANIANQGTGQITPEALYARARAYDPEIPAGQQGQNNQQNG